MVYTTVGWQDGTGPTLYPGLVQMDNGIQQADTDISSLSATAVSFASSVSALQSVTGSTSGQVRQLAGYYAAGDGGEGLVVRTNSGKTVNGGTVFSCASGGTARWERIYSGAISPKWFGARGDGVTDDTTAFAAWATYIAAQATLDPAGSGWKFGYVEGYIPAGSYLITSEDAFIKMPGTRTLGLKISGAGEFTTQILFQPTIPAGQERYLIKNVEASPAQNGWLALSISDMYFRGMTSGCSFMLSTSDGGPQQYVFHRIVWTDFKYGLRLTGTDVNSEFAFFACGMRGTWTHFLWMETSDQFLNYNFDSCNFEVETGNLIRATKGGNVNVRGGSLIMINPATATAGTFFRLDNPTNSSYGASRLHCEGVRFELRSANARIIVCSWQAGTVTFDSCDMASHQPASYSSTFTSAEFWIWNTQLAMILWKNCSIIGKHDYNFYTGVAVENNIIRYENCEHANFAEAKDMLNILNVDSNSNLGGTPLVQFENCRGTYWTVLPRRVAFDSDHNWHLNTFANRIKRKWVSFKTDTGRNPTSGGSVGVRLPLNSVITRVSFYAPAFGTSTQTGWNLTLRTTDGTPTTIHTHSPGTQLQNGFSSQADTWFVCNTDARRNIDLVASATLDQSTTSFMGLVEYIG